MFKVLNDLAPSYLSRLINKKSHNKRLWSTAQYEDRNIQPIFHRTPQALNSPFIATEPRTWISLPNDLKAEGDITEFKEKLKTYLLERSWASGGILPKPWAFPLWQGSSLADVEHLQWSFQVLIIYILGSLGQQLSPFLNLGWLPWQRSTLKCVA